MATSKTIRRLTRKPLLSQPFQKAIAATTEALILDPNLSFGQKMAKCRELVASGQATDMKAAWQLIHSDEIR